MQRGEKWSLHDINDAQKILRIWSYAKIFPTYFLYISNLKNNYLIDLFSKIVEVNWIDGQDKFFMIKDWKQAVFIREYASEIRGVLICKQIVCNKKEYTDTYF